MILGQVQSEPHICSHVDFLLLCFSPSSSSPIISLPHHLAPPSSRATYFFLDNTAESADSEFITLIFTGFSQLRKPARVCTPGWPASTVSFFLFPILLSPKSAVPPTLQWGLTPSTATRRAAAPLHLRCLALMGPQRHRAAQHSTSSQSLKLPPAVTLPHMPPLTSMCPVHPAHRTARNQHAHQDWVCKFFFSFVTRTFDHVVVGPTVLCRTLPYTTHNPAAAATSPPIRSDSLRLPRRALFSFLFDLFLQAFCNDTASFWLPPQRCQVLYSFKCILCGKAGHHACSRSYPKQGCFCVDLVETTGKAVYPTDLQVLLERADLVSTELSPCLPESDLSVRDIKQLSKGQKKRQCSAAAKARANPAEAASTTCPARHQAAPPSHTTSLPLNAPLCHAEAPANVPSHRELLL